MTETGRVATCNWPGDGPCPMHAPGRVATPVQQRVMFTLRCPEHGDLEGLWSSEADAEYAYAEHVRFRHQHEHRWEPLRSVPPSWRCRDCPEVTEARP